MSHFPAGGACSIEGLLRIDGEPLLSHRVKLHFLKLPKYVPSRGNAVSAPAE